MKNMQNIMVALDLRGDEGAHALAFAFELAASMGGRVHLVHVLTVRGVSNLAALPPEVIRDADSSAREQLRILSVPYAASERLGQQSVRFGDPVPTLLSAAKEVGADLIVLCGPHGGGVRRVLLGSVAEGVLRQASCPVLVMRPGPNG